MSYDYSKEFLEGNNNVLRRLIELDANAGQLEMTFDNQKELNRTRQVILNLLSSLALNYPDQYAGLRERMRTWAMYQGEKWHLFVGHPRHRLTGRTPRVAEILSTARAHFTPLTQEGPAGVSSERDAVYGEVIGNPDEFNVFIAWVATRSAETQVIRAELDKPPTNMNAFRLFRKVGWDFELEGDSTLLLVRDTAERRRARGD